MRPKTASLHPLLILFAVALVSVLFVVSCGGGATATAVPTGAQVTEDTTAAETAAAEAAAAANEAAAAETEAAAAEAAAAEAAAAEAAAAEAAAAEETALAGAPKYGGTLVMAIVADYLTLDPPMQTTQVDVAITQGLYDNLLMVQPDGTVKPELATSWEGNADLSSFTFHLRRGVKFHNGKEFKAEDVLASFTRLMDPVLDSPIRLTFTEAIEDIVIIDDYTIRFDLVGPNSFFLDTLSVYQARIVPADVDVSRLHLEEFGTGPFMLVEHLPGERSVMVRNPDYWEEGKPYLDEIEIRLIREPATRAAALKSGDVHVLYDLPPGSVADIELHPDTQVIEAASTAWIGFPMRVDREPFDNILVRKAIQAATDREAIRQVALLGRGVIAYDHVVPPDSPLFAPQHKPPDYDPELAKQLLAEAGYPDGIDITLHTADVGTGMIEMAVALKESAAPAGIRIDIQREASDAFWGSVWNTEAFTVVWWFGRPNPDQILSIAYMRDSSWNAQRYFNDELDELIVRARGEQLEDQVVTYARIQEILIDNVPQIVVAYKPALYGVRNNVRGVAPHPLGWGLLQDGWFDD